LLHLAVLIVAPGCLLAAWWQATRAESGNLLSWLYAVEWPAFAVISVIMWWQVVHDNDPLQRLLRHKANEEQKAKVASQQTSVRRVDEEDEELRAYNDYLASLAAGSRKDSRR
jgi:DNA-binding transcriptional regulator of glucitol operon